MSGMNAQRIAKRLHVELHWTVEKIAGAIPCSPDMVRRWLREENQPRGVRKAKLYLLAEKYLTNGKTVLAR